MIMNSAIKQLILCTCNEYQNEEQIIIKRNNEQDQKTDLSNNRETEGSSKGRQRQRKTEVEIKMDTAS